MTVIRMEYQEKAGYVISIRGHAGYGAANHLPQGCDVVCAAISTLACTLLETIRIMGGLGKLDLMDSQCESGDIRIRVKAKRERQDELKTTIHTIFTGFQMLNEEYPAFVTISK